ncbi:MAG TPA: SpoIIE family protein phosphatase [Bacteroidota bacterium]|nr:SpoIIE family protein phosphatase [Bacteroidota bacterium]
MTKERNYRKLFFLAMAVVFSVSTLTYGIVWILDAHAGQDLSPVELGFDFDYIAGESVYLVKEVYASAPAEAAGLKVKDRIDAIDGHRIESPSYLDSVWRKHNPGDSVRLNVVRTGIALPFHLTGIFRARQSTTGEGGVEWIANEVKNVYVIPFILIGLTVLLFRFDDLHAWLLALLFASFSSVWGTNGFSSLPAFKSFALGYRAILSSILGPVFYSFFALFPVRSRIDRRVPWLKWVALVCAMTCAITGFRTGDMVLPAPFNRILKEPYPHSIPFFFSAGLLVLGLLALVLNFAGTNDAQVRRKIRVILWGTGLGVVPILAVAMAENLVGFRASNLLNTVLVLLLLLFPTTFAYAVVRHRVMEIPALIKRSARYLLVQRGFTFLLALISIGLVLVFALSLPQYIRPFVDVSSPLGVVLGSVFGTVLLWGGTQVHRRVSGTIDRAFFRSAYDIRQILENLAERSASMTSRNDLASLLGLHLNAALQPKRLIIYMSTKGGKLESVLGDPPTELRSLNADHPFLTALAIRGEPVVASSGEPSRSGSPSFLKALEPECFVPMVARGSHLVGLIVVGARLSEDPFSGEDKRLLSLVARQAANALDNIRLAEEIAQRIENEQRVARETEISRRILEADNARKTKELEEARQLQLSMLPSGLPVMRNLELAVLMKTATEVGGDYYDFALSDDGTLTIALGDATGHGLKAGTMVVAAKSLFNSFSGLPDLLAIFERMTEGIKKLNMKPLYMSMLLLRVNDRAARVASAGMPCPLVYRAESGVVEEITMKGMPLGAFTDFPYEVKSFSLMPGDVILLMSDGFPELFDEKEEMLGSGRAAQKLKEVGSREPKEIIDALVALGESWSDGRAQGDDMTFVVVKARKQSTEESEELRSKI